LRSRFISRHLYARLQVSVWSICDLFCPVSV